MNQVFDPSHDVLHALPMMLLLGVGLVLMLLDAFNARKSLFIVTGLGLLASAVTAFPVGGNAEYALYFNNMIGFGGIASLVHIFICLIAFFSLFFIDDFFERRNKRGGEIYPLVVFACIGMTMLATANDLLVVFVGLEIMSVSLYIMAGMFPKRSSSNEAALKYFLLGAFATGFLLYGIALLYGLSGIDSGNPTTQLDKLAGMIESIRGNALFYVSMGLILIGFAFKIAAFPFHNWTPDVYTGAPTPLVGFMATGSKLAAFTALALFMQKMTPQADDKIIFFLGTMAVLSMVYGNIVAVQQTNLKRILAYSSIAHTGYVLLGVCAGSAATQSGANTGGYLAVIFYMIIYSFMTIGAFGIISMVETNEEDAELSRWKGLGLRYPWLGVAMSVFLFSMAGMPPMAGFMGKYMVFGSAIMSGYYAWSIIGILSSVIGAYYYLRVIVVMYFQKPTEDEAMPVVDVSRSFPMVGAMILVAIIILLGIFPNAIYSPLDNFFSNAGFFMSVK